MSTENGEIREQVRQQYEKYPYPAGEDDFDLPLNKGVVTGCPWYFFDWYWPARKHTQDLDILVAGSGTGQAAKVAVHVPEARVTAIDISQTSLDATQKLLAHNNISNVELFNLSIEEVDGLNKKFDLIYCTGVLHHLPDPDFGLRCLKNVLRESGSMCLMVYSKYGRDGVYIMQEFFRRLGLTQELMNEEALKGIRQFLKSMPPYHPVKHRMELFDNYDISDNETVDLFLHPSDRAYTLSDVYRLLEDNGMVMQRIINRAHYAPSCSGLVDSAYYSNICQLQPNEQLVVGELYRASNIMHEFVACPAERPRETWEIRFDCDNWKGLIPVKNPMVKAEHKRHTGEAVVRLSLPGHLYRDIYLEIDKAQLAMVELADGKRTLEQIHRELNTTAGAEVEADQVSKYFSLIYDYDYIWFRKSPRI